MDHPDYRRLPKPDLVGVTAFTSQAPRAYEVAGMYRAMGVPVVIGGIHATFCRDEALEHADAVVTGEAELVWGQVLADARENALRRVYAGGLSSMDAIPTARHDLLNGRYYFGSVQTTRGCPLNCSFCSVTAFNGHRYRLRPIADVVRAFGAIREKHVLIVDDNLIGTRPELIARAGRKWRGRRNRCRVECSLSPGSRARSICRPESQNPYWNLPEAARFGNLKNFV